MSAIDYGAGGRLAVVRHLVTLAGELHGTCACRVRRGEASFDGLLTTIRFAEARGLALWARNAEHVLELVAQNLGAALKGPDQRIARARWRCLARQ